MLEARARAAVVTMFFISGISGLVYQVVWVRQFARIFGNTVHSAALVTGVFMGGLGLGGYFVGRLADRRFRADTTHPLRAYGAFELGIGALGLLFAIVLPRMTSISASLTSYERGAGGFWELSTAAHAVRYAAAILTVLPATFLMGGTLTLLIRFVVARDIAAVGSRVGLLYGVNTAGAALGALLTDFFLVPRLGLVSTQIAAVALNVAAGLAALALAKQTIAEPVQAPEETASETAESDADATRLAALMGGSLLLAGFAAMGLEILWFRLLAEILGSLRVVYSLLLAVILTGIWIGALLGGWAHRRFGRPVLLFVAGQVLLTIVTLALLGFVDHSALAARHLNAMRDTFRAADPGARALIELWSNLRAIGMLVLAPSILMGATFPIANAIVQRAEARVAGRAGLLYLANTAGNVIGSAVSGFVLLPALGLQQTAVVLLACSGASVIPIALASRDRSARDEGARPIEIAFLGAIAALIAGISGFAQLPRELLLKGSMPNDAERIAQRIVSVSEGLNETIVIAEVPGYKTRLYTSGHSMAADGPASQRYMRAFSHLPLLSLDHPENVLVICFGTGNTLHAASLHPVKKIEVADLSRHVLEHARFFRASNHDVLQDPRVSVFVNDGRHHLLMGKPGTYDLITLEPPPISFAGISSLYSRELYELARSRLAPGGYLSQWLPGYQLGGEGVLTMVRAFIDVFPASVMVSGDDGELILLGRNDASIAVDPDAIARRLAERPRVREDMDRIEMGTLTEIVGTFAASADTLRAATQSAPPLSDDRPSIEYIRRSRIGTLGAAWMPLELFDTSKVAAWCPRCSAAIPDLEPYLRVRQRIYASDWFRGRQPDGSLPMDAEIASWIAKSPYLKRLYGGEAYAARRAGIAHLARGDVDLAIGALQYAVLASKGDPAAFEDLAHAYIAAGDYNGAAEACARSLGGDKNRASAHFTFADVLAHLGQGGPATNEFEAGFKLDPDDAGAHYAFATLLNGLGKKDEAEAEMQTALALDPYEPRSNLVLCKRAAKRGDLDAASRHCDIAAALGVTIPADLAEKLAKRR